MEQQEPLVFNKPLSSLSEADQILYKLVMKHREEFKKIQDQAKELELNMVKKSWCY